MDFRMRNLKENKGNYNSMVQFPRNNESLPHYDQQQNGKIRQIEGRLNALSESHRAESQNNSNVFYRLEQRIGMLQNRISGLGQGNMMYNVSQMVTKKHDCEYQHDSLRSAVAVIEARMQDQLDMRLRGLGNTKQDLGIGLQSLKEELGRENRADKEVFSRFVREIKDSFANLKETLAKDREYVKEAIFQVQNGQQTIANKSSRAVEGLAAVNSERQEKLERKIATMRDDWNTFKLITNQKLEDYKTLIVNVQSSALQSLQRAKARESGGDIDKIKEELSEWKQLTEQKNLNVFRQISNAMKVMRMEWRKEHDELSKELEEVTKSIKQARQSLTKRFEKDLREVGQTMTEHFDAFTSELEQVNDLVALSKKELEEKISNGMDEIKGNISLRHAELAQLAHQSQQKINDIESALKVATSGLKNEIALLEKKAASDIQQLAQSIAADNSQWQKELSKTVKELKDAFAKDIQASSSTLEKQNAENNKKLQSSIETLKKSIETGLSAERSETAKQVSKVTSEITALITDWSGKLKKERETGETTLKEAITQAKKEAAEIKQALEGEKTKTAQRVTEDGKKFTELKASVDQTVVKIGKQSEEQDAKLNKKIDTLKTELQAKIKMSNDKLLQQMGSKKDADAKAKEDEAKARGAELDKKISDANAKIKTELVLQIGKVSKSVAEDSQKTAKKVESLTTTYKKDLQAQTQKQRKFCVDEITKAKAEIEIKMKARDEKLANEVSVKKDAQAKQKQEESKSKIAQLDKKINETATKVKTEMMAEVAKIKTAQAEEITKIKSQMQAKFKAGQEQKAKKEAQAKLKQKQNELKAKSVELDTKIDLAKKDIQKSTADQIAKLTTQLEAKMKTSSQASSKSALQDKAKRQQLQKKLGEVKLQVEKKIAELKGVSLVNMKAQQQESNRIQDQKLQNLRQEFSKSITSATAPCKETSQRLQKLFTASQQARELLAQSVRKVETGLFSQRQRNKSIYEKMCSDILDLADSVTVVISQLKPAQK